MTADGRSAAGVRVRIYHTDDRGYYSPGGMDEGQARLCGVLESGADGDFEVRTILPAPYATGGPRPHMHFDVQLPNGGQRLYTLQWKEAREGLDPGAGDRKARTRPLVKDDQGHLWLAYDIALPDGD